MIPEGFSESTGSALDMWLLFFRGWLRSLATITATVAQAGANIDEVHHQRAFTTLSAQSVEVELIIQTRNRAHIAEVLAALQAAGLEAPTVCRLRGQCQQRH